MRRFLLAASTLSLMFCFPWDGVGLQAASFEKEPAPASADDQIKQALAVADKLAKDRLVIEKTESKRSQLAEDLRKKQIEALQLMKKRAELEDQLLRSEKASKEGAESKTLQTQLQSISDEISRADTQRDKLRNEVEDAARTKDRLERAREYQIVGLRRLAGDIAHSFVQDPSSNSRFLEGLTAMLSNRYGYASKAHSPIELLVAAARRDWGVREGETVAAMLRRNQEALEQDVSPITKNYLKLRQTLRDLTPENEQLNAQERELLWSDVLATVIRSKSLKDPVVPFQEKVARDERRATEYRFGYQALVEADPDLPVNVEFLVPIASYPLPANLDDAVRYVSLLQTFAKRLPADQPDFVQLRGRLAQWLRSYKTRQQWKDSNHQHAVFGMLASLANTYASKRDLYSAGREILDELSKADRFAFDRVTDLMEMPAATRRAWLLTRSIEVDFEATPARDALRHLAAQVRLQIWIDQTAAADLTPVRLKMNGPWFEVVHKVLEQTSLTADFISEDIFWIGPRDGRQLAEAALGRSLLRIPEGTDGKAAAILRRTVALDFRDTPFADAIEFFRDYTGENIVLLTPQLGKETVTLQANELPLHLVLTLIADKLGADWRSGNDTIAIGAPGLVERFRLLAQSDRLRKHRLDALRSKGSAAAAAMLRPVTFDFNQTPLSDIVEFFGQYAGVELVFNAANKRTPIALSLQEVSMAWGLDMILFETELTWDVRGNILFIGDEKAVAAFRAETDAAGDRPKK